MRTHVEDLSNKNTICATLKSRMHFNLTSTNTIFFDLGLDTPPPETEAPPTIRLGYLLALVRKSWNCFVCDSG